MTSHTEKQLCGDATIAPIKVAHITTIDQSLRHLLLNQLCSIQQAGYDVTGISSTGPNVPDIEAANIRHIAIEITRRVTPLADLRALWQLYRTLRSEQFTIVHVHTPKPGLLGPIAAWLVGTPIIVYTLRSFFFHHMPPLMNYPLIILERIVSNIVTVTLSQNSEDIKTAIQANIYPSNNIKLLGNGIDINRFDPTNIDEQTLKSKRRELGLPTNAIIVGFIGRLVKEKGLLDLLQVGHKLIERLPNLHFLIIGKVDQEKPDALTPEIAHTYGIEKHCTFTGARDDIPEMLSLMNVLVLPSHREGFPRSPMEASSMKIPVVATNIRGCREAVEHNRNGLLVPLGDSQALANAILEILTNPQKAQKMGEEGRRIALERFDEREVFKKVKAEYKRLLREKGLPNTQ